MIVFTLKYFLPYYKHSVIGKCHYYCYYNYLVNEMLLAN